MSKKPKPADEGSLSEYAAKASNALGGPPVELHDSSADYVEGGQVWIKDSSIRQIDASALHLEGSGAGIIRADTVDARDGAVVFAAAQNASLENVRNSTIVSQQIKAKDVHTVFLVAGRVEGSVKATFTPLTALFAGAGAGAVIILLQVLLNQLFSRNHKR